MAMSMVSSACSKIMSNVQWDATKKRAMTEGKIEVACWNDTVNSTMALNLFRGYQTSHMLLSANRKQDPVLSKRGLAGPHR